MVDLPCATQARASDESLHGTASLVRGWVLVEQPGPWGHDAALESRLPRAVAEELLAWGRAVGLRVLLLRRVAEAHEGPLRCFIASSQRTNRWIEEAEFDDPSELLDIDFRPLAEGQPVGFGRPRSEPLYLVCTNGRHDPCCARLGRPIARALLPAVGSAAWECSHVGGDRFAGNLVVLPHGFYFGNLDPESADRVVARYRGGVIDLDHYRGSAGDPYAVQAAEYFVRRETGLVGVDDVVPAGYRRVRPGVVEVHLRGPGTRRFRVLVTVSYDDARILTCTADTPSRPLRFSLLELEIS